MKTLSVAVLMFAVGCGSGGGGGVGGGAGGSGGGGAGGGAGGGGTTLMPGQSCTGDFSCEAGGTSALFCESKGGPLNEGTLKRYPCNGVMGCHQQGATMFCDFTGAQNGAACPEMERNHAFCRTSSNDGGVFVHCIPDGGVWRTQPCSRCYTQGSSVFCEP